MTPPKYTFTPRWKEDLVCSCADGELVIDLTMGVPNVYFYGEATWAKRAPAWARHQRAEILEELEDWCRANKVPLTIFEEGEEPAETAVPPEAPAMALPSRAAPITALVFLALFVAGGLWLAFGNPLLRYRIEGTWGTMTVPRIILTIHRDGRYEWGPANPRDGAMQRGRWQLHGTELELVGAESLERRPIRLVSGRSTIRAHTLMLGPDMYVARDHP